MVTNAERQAVYRARQLEDTNGSSERLSMIVDAHAKRAVERLSKCYGVTQKAMLESVLSQAEQQTITAAADIPNSQADYFSKKLRLKKC